MPEIEVLSESDKRELRKLVALSKQGRFNSIPNLDQSLFDEIHQAPETYIALAPSGGIPAATPMGTGATLDFAQGDIPGKATCDIYNLVGGALQSADFQKEVYNLTSSEITQQWIPVTRSKWGQWLALSGSGGGSDCAARNEVWQIYIIGTPIAGTFSLTFTANATIGTITIDFNATAAEVKTAFVTHSQIASADISSGGGPLPNSSVQVEFQGARAGEPIDAPLVNKSGLSTTPGTGTVGDTEGVGVIVTRYQPGYAGA